MIRKVFCKANSHLWNVCFHVFLWNIEKQCKSVFSCWKEPDLLRAPEQDPPQRGLLCVYIYGLSGHIAPYLNDPKPYSNDLEISVKSHVKVMLMSTSQQMLHQDQLNVLFIIILTVVI